MACDRTAETTHSMRFMLIAIESGHAIEASERSVIAPAQVIVELLARDHIAAAVALKGDHRASAMVQTSVTSSWGSCDQ